MQKKLEMQLTRISQVEQAIAQYKEQIINHPLYKNIKTLDDLKIFMEHHIFAVWDFMSLLKALQRNLTCIDIPWFPVGDANTRYLINEIVTGEESDLDHNGNRKSHYEVYLDAMEQCRADTTVINNFIQVLKDGKGLQEALRVSHVPNAAMNFVNNTFDVIHHSSLAVQSAVFTFSREDLIPEMFIAIISDLDNRFPDSVSIFRYYLERHIEVDGDHHSNLALEMTATLCKNDETIWKHAIAAVKKSLELRIKLWDAALDEINRRNKA